MNTNLLRIRTLSIWLATAALVVASSAVAQGTLDPGSRVEELMARETTLGADRPFVAPDGSFRVLLPVPLTEPLVEREGQIILWLDVGSTEPAACAVHSEPIDPAVMLDRRSEASLPVETENSPILARELHSIAADHVGPEIVLAADWLYSADDDGDEKLGMLKVRVATLGEGGLVCFHDQIGYRETFDGIVQRLVRSWLWPTRAPEPYLYREVTVTRLDGQPVSIDRSSVLLDEDGDYVYRTYSSSLSALDATTLVGEDEFRAEYATATGELTNVLSVVSDRNGLATHLDFSPVGDETWRASGIFESKPFKAEIPRGVLNSALRDQKETRLFLQTAKSGDRLVQEMWAPELDPTQMTSGTVEFQGFRDHLARAKISVAGLELLAEIDAEGSLVRATGDMAGSKIEIERLFVAGEVPYVVDPEASDDAAQ